MTRSLDLSLCSSSGSLSFEEEKPHVLCECRPIWDVGGSCDTGVLGSHMAVSNAAVALGDHQFLPAADYVSSCSLVATGSGTRCKPLRADLLIENWSRPWRMARLRMRKSRSPTGF